MPISRKSPEPEQITVDIDGEMVTITATQNGHGWGLLEAYAIELAKHKGAVEREWSNTATKSPR